MPQERLEPAQLLPQLPPERRVLFMSGATDDAEVRHCVLLVISAAIQKLFPATRRVMKVPDVPDA